MTEKDSVLTKLPQVLPEWFALHKRDLPWRKDRDPYRIWISEIMLQQTRVEAVKGYFARFLQQLPTVEALAAAKDEELTKLWEGLGYYSRVRNLKKAAIVVMEKYGGIFPGEYAQVLSLPGIGPYTAGAICSIAYDQKTPAVDGNVLRIYSRLLADSTPIDDNAFRTRVAQDLQRIYPEQAGDFTQALMELGATVCGPNRKPECKACPCCDFCLSRRDGTQESYPVKAEKKQRRQENMTVFLLKCDDSYALQKRPTSGLLAGLWEFPHTEGFLSLQQAISFLEEQNIQIMEIERQVEKKHIFTHIQWNMRGFYIRVREPGGKFLWHTEKTIRQSIALPTAFRQFWEDPQRLSSR